MSEKLFHSIGAEGRRAVGGRSAPIVADDDGVRGAKCFDQRKRIARQGLLVRVAIRNRGRDGSRA